MTGLITYAFRHLTQVLNMTVDDDDALFDAAAQVRLNAYCPFSHFSVGAALLDDAGNLQLGCNVENSAYPEGTCAEANAIGAMIASGATRIRRIAIVGGHDEVEFCTPCGGCRQKIAEFSDENTRILLMDEQGDVTEYSVADLLPKSFRLEQ